MKMKKKRKKERKNIKKYRRNKFNRYRKLFWKRKNKFNEELFSPKKKEKVFLKKLKVNKNIIDVYDEQKNVFSIYFWFKNEKLKIFWKEIRKKIKIIVTNGIENVKNSLSELCVNFILKKKCFFHLMKKIKKY